MADRYRTRHLVETVDSDDFDLIDTLARLYDEPYADSSAIPTYRVCQLARKHVTVALSGDGGDESFGGYRRYRLHLMEERMRAALPLALRRPLFGAARPRLSRRPTGRRACSAPRPPSRRWRATSVEAYFHSVSILREPMREQLVQRRASRRELGGYSAGEVFDRHAARAGTDDPLALIQYLDLKTYLVGDINTKVDRASMAHSLEVREPLMDHPLVEWLATLAVVAQAARAAKASTCSRRRWSRTCRTMSCTGRRWASPCRSRAGSAARCASGCRMRCSASGWPKRAFSTTLSGAAC